MSEINSPGKRGSSGVPVLGKRHQCRGGAGGGEDGTGRNTAEKQFKDELSLGTPEESSQMVGKSPKSDIKAAQR